MNLRKTIEKAGGGVYRIFEFAPGVFHVLDAGGRTVDEFSIVELHGVDGGASVKQAFRHRALRPGVPDLASGFAHELNQDRKRN